LVVGTYAARARYWNRKRDRDVVGQKRVLPTIRVKKANVIAGEIAEGLRAALEQFEALTDDTKR